MKIDLSIKEERDKLAKMASAMAIAGCARLAEEFAPNAAKMTGDEALRKFAKALRKSKTEA